VEPIEYTERSALIAAQVITNINSKATIKGASFAQQYLLQQGMKKFGDKGAQAATKELDQLHQRNCFTPIDVSNI
jgi:hypothetical protein